MDSAYAKDSTNLGKTLQQSYQIVVDKLQAKPLNGDHHSCQAKCPAHDDTNPSLTVTLADGMIKVKCHKLCSQRDVITAIEEVTGINISKIGAKTPKIQKQAPPIAPTAPVPVAKTTEDKCNNTKMQSIINASKPVRTERAVWPYFIARGFAEDTISKLSDDILFHPALDYWIPSTNNNAKSIGKFPTIIAKVRNAETHKIVGTHRTYLEPGADKKLQRDEHPAKKLQADIAEPDSKKKASLTNSYVQVTRAKGTGIIAASEGIENALAAVQLGITEEAISACTATKFDTLKINGVELFFIHDGGDAAEKALGQFHANNKTAEIIHSVKANATENEKKDLNDALLAGTGFTVTDGLPATAALPEPVNKAVAITTELSNYYDELFSEDLTELGNTARLLKMHSDDLKYVEEYQYFLSWTGSKWTTDPQGLRALHTAKNVGLRLMKITAPILRAAKESTDKEWIKESQQLVAFAKKSNTFNSVYASVKFAKADPRFLIKKDALDTDRMNLNCLNGTIDLKSGDLRKHDKADLITRQANAVYDPMASSERWERFIDEVTGGDKNYATYLQKAAGYSITGHTREHCFFMLIGEGRNGKSTFIEVIRHVLGEFSQTVDFRTFLTKKSDSGANPEIAGMAGARLVVAAEGPEGKAMDEAAIKYVCGDDIISARFLHQNPITFSPTHTIWLSTNHKPIIKGTDDGIWQRIKLLPFDESFIGREDKDLKNDLLKPESISGILTWLVEGCTMWQHDGHLRDCEKVVIAKAEYRKEMDDIGQWIEECCIVDEHAITPSKELYSNYVTFKQERNEFVITKNMFTRRVKKHLVGCAGARDTTGDRSLKGIKLKVSSYR